MNQLVAALLCTPPRRTGRRFTPDGYTPPLPDGSFAAAQAKGRERYEGFVEALGRRMARGRKLADEIIQDVPSSEPKPKHSEDSDDRQFR